MTTSYHRQTAQFLAIVGQNMPELSKKEMQRWIDNPPRVGIALTDAFKEPPAADAARLQQCDVLELPARDTAFQPADYFGTMTMYLYTDHRFTEKVLPACDEVLTTSAAMITSFDLLEAADNEQIRAGLPKDHAFSDPSVFCSHLAGMLSRQPKGIEGPLVNSGAANIFYVNVADKVVAVDINWSGSHRVWRVFAKETVVDMTVDDRPWSANSRAFSATAVA